MGHLLYLIFRCDGDVIESLDFVRIFEGTKHTQRGLCLAPQMLPLLQLKFLCCYNRGGMELPSRWLEKRHLRHASKEEK